MAPGLLSFLANQDFGGTHKTPGYSRAKRESLFPLLMGHQTGILV